jgi:hypothetical protein
LDPAKLYGCGAQNVTGLEPNVSRIAEAGDGFRNYALGLPPGDPAADALLRLADELDAKARELEATGE